MSDILSLERTEVAVTETAGSAAVAAVSAPSACAISEKMSEIPHYSLHSRGSFLRQ